MIFTFHQPVCLFVNFVNASEILLNVDLSVCLSTFIFSYTGKLKIYILILLQKFQYYFHKFTYVNVFKIN